MNKKIRVLLIFFTLLGASQPVWSETFDALVGDLNAKSFRDKLSAVKALSEIDDARVLPTLKAMQGGMLYSYGENNALAMISGREDTLTAIAVLSQNSLGAVDESELTKVRINNRLRRMLRSLISVMELSADNVSVRLSSARNLLKNPDENLREKLVERLNVEQENGIVDVLELVVALIDIEQNDLKVRLAALDTLGQSVEPEAVVVVRRLAERDEDGQFVEQETQLALAAEKKIKID